METSDKIKSQNSNNKLALTGWIITLILLIVSFLFITSDFFKIGNIEVKENKYVSTKEILEIANINAREINVFHLDISEIEARLLQDLRISEVNITRKLPTTIIINIKERKPVAFAEFKYGFVQLDKDATVFSISKSISNTNIPTIKGPMLGNIHIGDKIENPDIQNILSYLGLLDETTLNSLKQVSIENNIISAITTNSILIKIGSLERIEEKANLTISILKDIKENNLKVEYIDLSYATPVIKIRQTEAISPKSELQNKKTNIQ